MIVYRNPLPQEMHEVYDLRWQELLDPSRPPDGTERDLYDESLQTIHGAVFLDGALVSTGRIHTPLHAPEVRQVRFMATREEWRGKGIGELLLRDMEAQTLSVAEGPVERFAANARVRALPFYIRAGYIPVSNEFDLVGVPHVQVEKQL